MLNRQWLWKLGVPIGFVLILVTMVLVWPEAIPKDSAAGEWTCSMHPQVRQSRPGPCPICGMNLIPVAELKSKTEIERRAGLETELVTYRELFKEVRTVGKLNYNESRVAYIPARVNGRVDRIFADFTGIQVKKGDHLVVLYCPSLYITQNALIGDLAALDRAKAAGAGEPELRSAQENLESSRQNLRTLGILPDQIEAIERTRRPNLYLTIHAPIGGTVIEKNARVGQYVKEGDMLYRIADLDPIWLYLDIYEYDLAWVRPGQAVEVILEAYPSESFRGVVTFVDPFLDDKTRTVKVRVNLKNAERRLKPAMYATALIRVRLLADGSPEATGLEGKYICPMHPEVVQEKPGKCPNCEMKLELVPAASRPMPAGHGDHQHHVKDQAAAAAAKKPAVVLAIRATAVLDTGRRQVAYRQRSDGAYELVELTLGARAEGKDDAGQSAAYFPVSKGLQDGDRVVARGGFLLDSQQQISGMPSLLYPQGQSASNLHSAHGGAGPTPAMNPAHKH